MKILMVCLGNICRSPLAEALMRHHLEKAGLDYEVDSAGTGNWHSGESPDHRSIKVAAHNGIDISSQRARQITAQDFETFDLIFTLDETIHRDVRRKASDPLYHNKIHLLRVFAGDKDGLVPDPYYDDIQAFHDVFSMIDDACRRIAERLKKNS